MRSLIESLTNAENQEQALSAQLKEVKVRNNSIQKLTDFGTLKNNYLAVRIGQDEELKHLRTKLADLESEVAIARKRLTDHNPSLLNLLEKRDTTRALYNQRLSRLLPKDAAVNPPANIASDQVSQDLSNKLISGEIERRALESKLAAVRNEQANFQARLNQIPARLQELAVLTRQRQEFASSLESLQHKPFFYVSTKALFSLLMLATFVGVLIAPKLNLLNLIGGVFMLAVVIGLFASTEFGQQRLGSIANTPLLNPNMDISRAVLLSEGDSNSFNWRLAQWTFLLQAWQRSPIFGNGLATSSYLSVLHNYAHNDYFRALAEEGIVGIVAFVTFLGVQAARLVQLLRYAPRGSAQQDLCSILLAILLAVLVAMCTENIWSHTTLFFYWWTLLGVAGWNWSEPQTSKSPVTISHPLQSR